MLQSPANYREHGLKIRSAGLGLMLHGLGRFRIEGFSIAILYPKGCIPLGVEIPSMNAPGLKWFRSGLHFKLDGA